MSDDMTAQAALSLLRPETSGLKEAASNLKAAKNEAAIDAAAKDFEAVFLSEMLKPMFEGLQVDPEFGGGKGEEVFRGFMLQEYGKLMAATGKVGIAEHVKQELMKAQEQKTHGT